MDKRRNATILVVDDDVVDVMAIRRALKKRSCQAPVREAHDGVEALDLLRGSRQKEGIPEPWLILLDLNMPRMNGLEFLREIRRDPELCQAVVFVLTTSNREEDRLQAYRESIAGFIEKAKVADEFWRVMDLIDNYARVVAFP